jgi:hypothetical protein
MAISAPVTALAFSEAKNNITSAKSAGATQREKSPFGDHARPHREGSAKRKAKGGGEAGKTQ